MNNPWDRRYAEPAYLFGEAPNAFLVAQRHHLPAGGKALAVRRWRG